MKILNEEWKENSHITYKNSIRYLQELRDSKELDLLVKDLHEEAFSKIDCLDCANCCKTTPAIVLKSDAKRIAKHLGMPPKTFIRKYLIEDIVGGYVINGVPCTFLDENNICRIYEVRPVACRSYPHTDESYFGRRAKINAKNTEICPAVYSIVEHLKTVEL